MPQTEVEKQWEKLILMYTRIQPFSYWTFIYFQYFILSNVVLDISEYIQLYILNYFLQKPLYVFLIFIPTKYESNNFFKKLTHIGYYFSS